MPRKKPTVYVQAPQVKTTYSIDACEKKFNSRKAARLHAYGHAVWDQIQKIYDPHSVHGHHDSYECCYSPDEACGFAGQMVLHPKRVRELGERLLDFNSARRVRKFSEVDELDRAVSKTLWRQR